MTSAVRLIRSPDLAEVSYAYAATAPASARLIFLAGSCPLDDTGAVVSPGDIRAQTAQAIAKMRIALDAVGAGLTDVIATRVLVATRQREDLVAAWSTVADAFDAHDVPSTLLGVAVLGYPHQLVEIEATAAVRDS